MKYTYYITIVATLAVAACAPDTKRSTVTPANEVVAPSDISDGDQMFIQEVGRMSLGEATTSQMALERSQTPAVRELAQTIIDYHAKADPELLEVTRGMGYEPPSDVDSGRNEFIDKLDEADGTTFDQTYVAGQKADHEQSLKLFRQEMADGTNPQLRAFATDHLPALEAIDTQVKQVEEEVGTPKS